MIITNPNPVKSQNEINEKYLQTAPLRSWLVMMHGTDEVLLNWQFIDERDGVRPAKAMTARLDDILPEAVRYTSSGFAMFCTLGAAAEEGEEGTGKRGLGAPPSCNLADKDKGSLDLTRAKVCGVGPTMVVNSGGFGDDGSPNQHGYWRRDPSSLAVWSVDQQVLAGLLSTDSAVTDATRVIRPPGTPHWKKGLRLAETVHTDPEAGVLVLPKVSKQQLATSKRHTKLVQAGAAIPAWNTPEWLTVEPQAKAWLSFVTIARGSGIGNLWPLSLRKKGKGYAPSVNEAISAKREKWKTFFAQYIAQPWAQWDPDVAAETWHSRGAWLKTRTALHFHYPEETLPHPESPEWVKVSRGALHWCQAVGKALKAHEAAPVYKPSEPPHGASVLAYRPPLARSEYDATDAVVTGAGAVMTLADLATQAEALGANIPCTCPSHDDSRPSAVMFENGNFFCSSCDETWAPPVPVIALSALMDEEVFDLFEEPKETPTKKLTVVTESHPIGDTLGRWISPTIPSEARVVVFAGPMGSGKSYAIKAAFAAADRALLVVSDRSLGRALAESLGCAYYEDIQGQILCKKVIVSIQSLEQIFAGSAHPWDVVIIEEGESTLTAMHGETVVRHGDDRSGHIYHHLDGIVRHTKQLVLADAGITQITLSQVKRWGFGSSDITIVRPPEGAKTIFSGQVAHVLESKADALVKGFELLAARAEGTGKPVAICVTEKREVLAWEAIAQKKGLRTIAIHGGASQEARDSVKNVDVSWSKVDVVIYNGAAGFGVSFDVPDHFVSLQTHTSFEGITTPQLVQKGARIRRGAELYIFVQDRTGGGPTDREKVRQAKLNCVTASKHVLRWVNGADGTPVQAPLDSEHFEAAVDVEWVSNCQQKSTGVQFWLSWAGRGGEVKVHPAYSDDDRDTAAKAFSEVVQAQKLAETADVLDALPLLDAAFNLLGRDPERKEKEQQEYQRAQTLNRFGTISEELVADTVHRGALWGRAQTLARAAHLLSDGAGAIEKEAKSLIRDGAVYTAHHKNGVLKTLVLVTGLKKAGFPLTQLLGAVTPSRPDPLPEGEYGMEEIIAADFPDLPALEIPEIEFTYTAGSLEGFKTWVFEQNKATNFRALGLGSVPKDFSTNPCAFFGTWLRRLGIKAKRRQSKTNPRRVLCQDSVETSLQRAWRASLSLQGWVVPSLAELTGYVPEQAPELVLEDGFLDDDFVPKVVEVKVVEEVVEKEKEVVEPTVSSKIPTLSDLHSWDGKGREPWAAPIPQAGGHAPLTAEQNYLCLVQTILPEGHPAVAAALAGDWTQPLLLQEAP